MYRNQKPSQELQNPNNLCFCFVFNMASLSSDYIKYVRTYCFVEKNFPYSVKTPCRDPLVAYYKWNTQSITYSTCFLWYHRASNKLNNFLVVSCPFVFKQSIFWGCEVKTLCVCVFYSIGGIASFLLGGFCLYFVLGIIMVLLTGILTYK